MSDASNGPEERRLFTTASANAALPLVSRIVRDIVDLHPQWREAISAFELEQDGATAEHESDEARVARERAGHLAGEIESCLDELEQVGCHFKGFEDGLVDFPSLRHGRVVYLCWQHGEAGVTHWHEVDDGFPGRRPLEDLHVGSDT